MVIPFPIILSSNIHTNLPINFYIPTITLIVLNSKQLFFFSMYLFEHVKSLIKKMLHFQI